MQGKRTRLRAATTDDVDRLVAWHADPDVARYWDGETFTRDEMRERLARGGVDAWIVERLDGEPVPRGGSSPRPTCAGAVGSGPPSARARSAPPRAEKRSGAERGEAATAGRSWERAGFVELSRGHAPDEDHLAPWVLMEYRSAR